MQVCFHANIYDLATSKIAKILQPAFESVENDLQSDYGGIMEHLWIDFELVESHAVRQKPFPFRFQKKVGGSVWSITGLRTPVSFNVGHYSVRPDFKHLLKLPHDRVATYSLGLIYASTSILIEKQKRLGGFDASKFRNNFLLSCSAKGYDLSW